NTSSPVPTTQSSAFLNAPGIPCAYSGQENSTASAPVNAERQSTTAAGRNSGFSSRSGLNAGIDASRSYADTDTPAGARFAAAVSSAALEDPARRLPDTVNKWGTAHRIKEAYSIT